MCSFPASRRRCAELGHQHGPTLPICVTSGASTVIVRTPSSMVPPPFCLFHSQHAESAATGTGDTPRFSTLNRRVLDRAVPQRSRLSPVAVPSRRGPEPASTSLVRVPAAAAAGRRPVPVRLRRPGLRRQQYGSRDVQPDLDRGTVGGRSCRGQADRCRGGDRAGQAAGIPQLDRPGDRQPALHDHGVGSVDAVREIMRNNTHLAAAKRFLTEDFGAAGTTGVWSAHHLNPVRTRCPSCARLTDRAQSGDLCGCGQPLPQMPQYW